MKKILALSLLLYGCATTWPVPPAFIQQDIKTTDFEIRTYQKNHSMTQPVHIYIEGDGHAFNARGTPTHNPTPQNTFLRDLAISDIQQNVAYIARPCQYNMSDKCTQSDWTDERFSQKIIDNISQTIKQIAKNRPITLIGYSGGALLSGLIIQQNPDINVQEWITIAGVLNHNDWTSYFGDKPLNKSIDLYTLPHVQQKHYIAEKDSVVPYELSQKWTNNNLIVIPNATHNNFPNIKINFSNR
jgi:predicted esterase